MNAERIVSTTQLEAPPPEYSQLPILYSSNNYTKKYISLYLVKNVCPHFKNKSVQSKWGHIMSIKPLLLSKLRLKLGRILLPNIELFRCRA